MLETDKSLRLFWVLFLLFQLIGWTCFLFYGKENTFFLINGSYGSFFDYFFYGATFLGEWPFIVISVFWVFKNYRQHIINFSLTFAMNGIISYLLKTYAFGPIQRPAAFFGAQNENLFLNPMIATNFYHSFPSGHTFTAFAGFTYLILLYRNSKATFLFFILATLTGISRIYNGQHFPEDVLVGAILGVALAFIIYTFIPMLKEVKSTKKL